MTEVVITADSLLPSRDSLRLTQVSYDENTERVMICINEEVFEFPMEWLRLNCQCQKCFNPVCQSFVMSYRQVVHDEIKLITVVAIEEKKLRVLFSGDHEGEFSVEWLYNRRMTENGREERQAKIYIRQPVPWVDNMKVQKAPYNEVIAMETGFQFFGESMCRDGIFVITDCPDRFVAREFEEKTGLTVLTTHYGYDFHVVNEPKPTNHAFTNIELDLHMDQPYLNTCPNIQYLHCLVQAEHGGENVMSDGVEAACVLRKRFPHHYKALTTICVEFEDIIDNGLTVYVSNASPVILLDKHGDPEFIRINFACRSSFFNGSIDEWEQVMPAIKEFYKILYELSITIKSNAGDILVFDNQRILHGRLGYDTSEPRRLEGWYSEWDTLLSQLRIAKIHNQKKAEQGKQIP